MARGGLGQQHVYLGLAVPTLMIGILNVFLVLAAELLLPLPQPSKLRPLRSPQLPQDQEKHAIFRRHIAGHQAAHWRSRRMVGCPSKTSLMSHTTASTLCMGRSTEQPMAP